MRCLLRENRKREKKTELTGFFLIGRWAFLLRFRYGETSERLPRRSFRRRRVGRFLHARKIDIFTPAPALTPARNRASRFRARATKSGPDWHIAAGKINDRKENCSGARSRRAVR